MGCIPSLGSRSLPFVPPERYSCTFAEFSSAPISLEGRILQHYKARSSPEQLPLETWGCPLRRALLLTLELKTQPWFCCGRARVEPIDLVAVEDSHRPQRAVCAQHYGDMSLHLKLYYHQATCWAWTASVIEALMAEVRVDLGPWHRSQTHSLSSLSQDLGIRSPGQS